MAHFLFVTDTIDATGTANLTSPLEFARPVIFPQKAFRILNMDFFFGQHLS